MNFFKLPKVLPFKFVPNTADGTPVYHMDEAYFCEQIMSWEMNTFYYQKWVKSDRTKLQCFSTVIPTAIKLYDLQRNVIKSFDWNIVVPGTGYSVYEVLLDFHDVADGIYVLFAEADIATSDIKWQALSEPFKLASAWPGTITFLYGHSFNDYDVAFTTGIKMLFRCEAAIMELQPDSDSTEYVNNGHSVQLLKATPYRIFKLNVGDPRGVPPWIADLLNRILCCDSVNIMGKTFSKNIGAKMEMSRQRGWPMVGAAIELVESINTMSLEFNDANLGSPGFITAYDIETTFFGPGTIVPITDIQKQE